MNNPSISERTQSFSDFLMERESRLYEIVNDPEKYAQWQSDFAEKSRRIDEKQKGQPTIWEQVQQWKADGTLYDEDDEPLDE